MTFGRAAGAYGSRLPGTNVLTVTAQDRAGNRGADTIAVTYEAPPAAFTLQGDARDRGPSTRILLTWTTVAGRWASLVRDGAVVARAPNNGRYHEDVPGGGGSHTYRVCIEGTGACSNRVVVTYEP